MSSLAKASTAYSSTPQSENDSSWDVDTPEEQFLASFELPLRGNFNYSAFGEFREIDIYTGYERWHVAIDSQSVYGTPWENQIGVAIYSVAGGTVVGVDTSDFGNYVMIEHIVSGESFYSIYAHLEAQLVSPGQAVDSSVQIGTMGNTGTPQTHLHLEVRKATNVDLSQDDPFSGFRWWALGGGGTWRSDFVDLGVIFGYDPDFPR